MLLQSGQTVLFQGDSITDCGRAYDDSANLGGGYAMLAAGLFHASHAAMGVRFVNRGISGNRVIDLKARWQEDCIDLKPDWVSILIGINDVWRRYDSDDPTPVASFEDDYRAILRRTQDETRAGLILLEPFVLPTPPDRAAWREDLDPKIDAVRRLAREFGAVYVPLDGIFAAMACRADPAFWAADGVHPTAAGHALIALEWLKVVGATRGL